MNGYEKLEARHRKEFNEFPIKFAYNNEQFEQGMRELGLEPTDLDKIFRGPHEGMFYRRSDIVALNIMLQRHVEERNAAIEADETGDGYVYEMFYTELTNHEYSWTGDVYETLDYLGYSWDDIESDPKLKHGFMKARDAVLEEGF